MRSKTIKRITLVSLLTLMTIGFISYKFGFLDFVIHNYDDKKLNSELEKITPITDTNSGASQASDQTQDTRSNEPDIIPEKAPMSGLSTVSIVHASRESVSGIDYSEIRSMVREAVSLTGGLDGIVKDGQTVVLKPNLVQMHSDITGKLFDTELNGITTDWRVTKAVAELVRELDPNGKIYVMEGSAGDDTRATMEYLHYTPEYIPEVDEFIAIEKDSGSWQQFDSPGLVKVELSHGLLHKEYYLNRKYKEADVVISIPCLKNNSGTVITGGIKNVAIGATPANIYGYSSTSLSRVRMVSHSLTKGDMDRWIYDYYMCRPVDFVIMDGLEGFQNGPVPSKRNSEKTDKMNMGLIVAGRDAVAVDTVEALLTGWDPESCPHLRYLSKSGIGIMDTSCILINGSQIDSVRKNFSTKLKGAEGTKITDNTPPSLGIDTAKLSDNYLNLSLSADKDTVKAEIYIDGNLFYPIITDDFKNIKIKTGKISKGNHSIKVLAYDRFLNHSERELTVSN